MDLTNISPKGLFAQWCRIDALEQRGELSPEEAWFLKTGIFDAMLQVGLEPEDVVPPDEWPLA